MYFLLSPAKNLDETPAPEALAYSQPDLLAEAKILMKDLKKLAPQEIAELMSVSDKIARLNVERNQAWQPPFTPENAKQAAFLFNGDVYEGLAAPELQAHALGYLQTHLGILSGLYGLLRPLDLIQPYRLEMGTAFANKHGANLYQFWGDRITDLIQARLDEQQSDTLINLASQEYFKAVSPKKLRARVIQPIFQDQKNGQYKVISFYAKRARGLMVRFAAEQGLTQAEDLKNFNLEGYEYSGEGKTKDEWVFRRAEQ